MGYAVPESPNTFARPAPTATERATVQAALPCPTRLQQRRKRGSKAVSLAGFWLEPSRHARSIPMTRIVGLSLKIKEHTARRSQSSSLMAFLYLVGTLSRSFERNKPLAARARGGSQARHQFRQ